MKFSIKKNDILNVLSNIQGLCGRKSNLAITTNVLLKTVENSICIIATDLETGFEGMYPASVENQGTIAVNAKKLYEIVRDFPSEEIYFCEIENHWVEIGNRENVEYHLVGMNPDDFPEIPKIESLTYFEIDSPNLKKMIERALMLGVSDDKRAHIIGIYFEKLELGDGQVIRMVSTNGSCLSKVDHFYEKGLELPEAPGFLLPKKGLGEVNKFLGTEGSVKMGFMDNHFLIKKDKEIIIIRLLEGEFPKYGDIIKKTGGNEIILDKQLFLMMLKRMSILASENYKGVIFGFSNDKLLITSTNPDLGESKEEMVIDFKGDAFDVAFNPKFFIDSINVIDGDKVVMIITDEESPCIIEQINDSSYLSVIMPMRI
jgi:DNA polymerase III subunit beta